MDKEVLTLVNMLNDKYVHVYKDEHNNIIVDGTIIIFDKEYDEFPVKIHKVNGSINWYGHISDEPFGSLKSLKNFPDIVTGNVYIFNNPKLTSLDGCPKEIYGSLICDHCNISDISGIASKINNNFIASNNPISDISALENITVGGNIELIDTPWANAHKNDIKNASIIVEKNMQETIFD